MINCPKHTQCPTCNALGQNGRHPRKGAFSSLRLALGVLDLCRQGKGRALLRYHIVSPGRLLLAQVRGSPADLSHCQELRGQRSVSDRLSGVINAQERNRNKHI